MSDSDWSIRHAFDVANHELIKHLNDARSFYSHNSGRRYLQAALESMKLFHSQAYVIMTMPETYLVRDFEKVKAYGALLVAQAEATILFLENEISLEQELIFERLKALFTENYYREDFSLLYARWYLAVPKADQQFADKAYNEVREYFERIKSETSVCEETI